MACQRFAFIGVGGVNVDLMMKLSVLECFQKFIDEDVWQLFFSFFKVWYRNLRKGKVL
jgi:hypothetical protein